MKEKPFTIKTKAELQNLGTKYHKFYIKGISRPITKALANEYIGLNHEVIVVPKEIK